MDTMHEYNNSFLKADKIFVDKVKILLKGGNEYSMMDIVSFTKLTKTQVSLSLEQLVLEESVEINLNKAKKKYYKIIKN